MREHPVQPLERPVQVQLDPAGRGRDRLPAVLGTPALDEAHADRAHASQLVDSLEALVNRLRQQGRELLVVEDLQVAAGRDLAYLERERECSSGRVPCNSGVYVWARPNSASRRGSFFLTHTVLYGFTYCGRVPAVALVAVRALNEDG